jgi:hypothetical protein
MNKTIGNIVIFLLVLSMVSNGAIDVQKAVSTVANLFKAGIAAIPTGDQEYRTPPAPARANRPR